MTAEEYELSDPGPDRECICEDAAKGLYNPDCYFHGTEGCELPEAPADPQGSRGAE
jgi:hypothetical protein